MDPFGDLCVDQPVGISRLYFESLDSLRLSKMFIQIKVVVLSTPYRMKKNKSFIITDPL